MQSLEGKSALVTGGGGGFGRAITHCLVRDGAAVTLMGRTQAKLDQARAMLAEQFPQARIATIAGDSTEEADIAAAVDAAAAHGGGLDIFASVVGGGSGWGPIEEFDYATFLASYKINIGSAFLAIKYGVPKMKAGGSLVFISSTAAEAQFVHLAPYCSAKAGLDQLIKTAASELGPRGIRLNCIRPGLTRTDGTEAGLLQNEAMVAKFMPLIPLGRIGEAMDIAEAVRFLAGPESSWTTGQSFAVDGGNELRGMPLPD